MNEINYVGEHLWVGKLGHFLILAIFIGSLLSAFSYIKNVREGNEGWLKLARWAFVSHTLAVLSVIGLILYIMMSKYYEYQYVWTHVSDELPFQYLFAAFWEGQEGSFLLWMFWNVILGLILLSRKGKWESPVLAIFAIIQAVLGSMILGIYVGWQEYSFKLGSSPFQLLRDTMDAPIFGQADYLELIKGNGLNPLLQNYWMTIHPPTLFLGFSSTLVPFAFALSGLWVKDHQGWLRSALPWALFSAGILGIGILMGGAWAYEALSFGGYWAWDPVENMSLVPWLILIGGIHTHLVAQSTGQSLRSTYFFYLLSFALVVYSTFLTRSGILGETSVHAFTEMGLEAQLLFFLGSVCLISLVFFIYRYKGIPVPEKEEALSSREFWMFMGSLVLFFSGILIAGSTSLPVYNKIHQIFEPLYQGRVITDPIPHYNKYQIWIALFIMILSSATQYLRFKEINWDKNRKKFLIHTGIHLIISSILFYPANLWLKPIAWQYHLMLFAGLYAVVANIAILLSYFQTKTKWVSSVFSHTGFGVMIIGILASGLNQKVISNNPFIMEGLIEGASEESLRKNILIFKDTPIRMQQYEVTYQSDTLDHFTRIYTLKFVENDKENRRIDSFFLNPSVIYDKSFTKIAASNPATFRYWDKDIFTHIASLPQVEMDLELRKQKEDSLTYETLNLGLNEPYFFKDRQYLEDQDTQIVREYKMILTGIDYSPEHPEYQPQKGDLAIGVDVKIERNDDEKVIDAKPVIVLRENLLYSYPVQINEWSTRIRLPESIFENLYTFEEDLRYQSFRLGVRDRIIKNENEIIFEGYVRNPVTHDYLAEEGDLAVGANIRVTSKEGKSYRVMPVFLIRKGEPLNVKSEIPELGIHLRFPLLDPKTEKAEISYAYAPKKKEPIPLEISTEALRSDYIVLEAIEFPGINLFWGGSSMMMLGLLLGMALKITKKGYPK
jgi:cytochrome c-type biogenesis protein CcmF